MEALRRRPWLTALVLAFIVVALAVGGFGLYLAGTAGRLPWQEDPTRIPITPFADIPGFGAPSETPTEPPGSPSPAADTSRFEIASLDGDIRLDSDLGQVRLHAEMRGAAWRR